MNKLLAQKIFFNGSPTPIEGPLKDIDNIADLVNKLIAFVLPLAAVIFFLVLVWGGYDYLLSRGNPEKIKGAQAKITAGIIGFFILVLSYFIVKLLASIFGLGAGIL